MKTVSDFYKTPNLSELKKNKNKGKTERKLRGHAENSDPDPLCTTTNKSIKTSTRNNAPKSVSTLEKNATACISEGDETTRSKKYRTIL